MNLNLSMELGRILSGFENQKIDLSGVSIIEMFEFSGMTRDAWCDALGISSSLWSQYRTKRVKIPPALREHALKLSLLGAALRMNAVDFIKK